MVTMNSLFRVVLPGRYLTLVLICAFVVVGAFLFLSDLNQQPKARLDDLIEGTAQRPYVSRVLIPGLLGLVAPDRSIQGATFAAELSQLAPVRSTLDWLSLPTDYGAVLLVFVVLQYLLVVGFAFAFRRLAVKLEIPHAERLSLISLLLLLLPAFLSHGYVYDYSTLFLWTLLLLMLAEQRFLLYLAVVALAALNKETALLIPLIWLTYGWTLHRPRFYWGMLVAQTAIVVACWALIAWVFRSNGGGLFEFNLPVHLATYQAAPLTIGLVSACMIAVLFLSYPVAPALLRSTLLLLIPLTGLYLFFGWPYEFRVFYEIYPALVMASALALRRIVTYSKHAGRSSAPPAAGGLLDSAVVPSGDRPPRTRSIYRMLLLTTILLAFFLRLWQLNELPPGLFIDEIYNGLDAQRIVSSAEFPLFFEANNGREPLFIYMQALSIWLLGPSAYALRLVAALVGTLTVAAIFVLARALLADAVDPDADLVRFGRRLPRAELATGLALIGAAGIAVAYWHVGLSRLGFRTILLPCLSALAMYFFWRGWRTGRARSWLLAGFWTGLTLYTYTSARLFPLVFVLFLFAEVLFRAKWLSSSVLRRQRFAGLGLMALAALVTVTPLAVTFLQAPSLLDGRTADVSVFTAPYAAMPGVPRERLGQNLNGIIDAFYTAGDRNPRHNLPVRPLQDPLLAVLFTVGLAAAIWRLGRSPYRLTVIWLAVMLLPTWLSVDAPHYLRMSGIAPPLAILYGIGAATLLVMLPGSLSQRRVVAGSLLAIVLVSGAFTWYDYFVRWPRTPELAEAFDRDQYWVAQNVQARLDAGGDQQILLAPRFFQSPAMRLLLGPIPYADEDQAAVQPSTPMDAGSPVAGAFFVEANAAADEVLFLITQRDGVPTVQRRAAADVSGQSVASLLRQHGDAVRAAQDGLPAPGVVVGELPPLSLMPATFPYMLSARFENGLELVGYAPVLEPVSCPLEGTSVPLTTYWRRLPAGQPVAQGTAMFAHLMLPGLQVQSNGTLGNGYPVDLWQPGEIVVDTRSFVLPAVDAGGKAFVKVGLYRRDLAGNFERSRLLDGNNNPAGDQVNISPSVVCADLPIVDTTGLRLTNVQFEDRVELVGLTAAPAQDGRQLPVQLAWRALDRMHTDYVAFVHLIDDQGQIVSQLDQPPGGVDHQTSMWAPGEMLSSQFNVPLPPDIDLRTHRLRIGLYEPVSGRQLPITAPSPSDDPTFIVLPVQ